ncbi:ribosomal protein L7/L12 [Catellatospora citrea]|uniref:ribosomal protein L7/L12 n=1 Tax=Catellatospora citrea TaxID=53366 RepID=UPI0033CE4DB3
MTGFLIAVIVVLLLIIGLLVTRRRRHDPTDLLGSALAAREAEHARSTRKDAGPPAAQGDALVHQVRLLMNQRKKIPAVKLWRESTGVSLADAVKAVELIAAGGTPTTTGQPVHPVLGPDLMANARALKQQGRPIEAIKLVRRHTGLGLREAKDVVDAL